MKLFRSIFVIYFLFLNNLVIHAQNIEFERFTTENGLSSNLISCIVQDEKGYLWIGTISGGINRFDGYNFQVYESDSSKLIHTSITSLFIDSENKLWVGTGVGLGYIDLYTSKYMEIIRLPEKGGNLLTGVSSITEDRKGNIWYGTVYEEGLFKINKKTKTFIEYTLSNNTISSLFVDSDGDLWVGTMGVGLSKYNAEVDQFSTFTGIGGNVENIPENYVWSINEDGNNSLIFVASSGLYSFNKTTNKFSEHPVTRELSSSFRNNEIRSVYEDKNDSIMWIGTWGKGIHKYDIKKHQYFNYQVEPNNPKSISNNDVNLIFKDHSGVMWIGTQDGLNMIDPATNLFAHYQNDPSDANSLNFNFITSFYEDHNGFIWIGTYGAGLDRFNPKTNKFKHFQKGDKPKNSLGNNAVRGLCEDDFNTLWIATMHGVDRYYPEENTFQHFKANPGVRNSISGNDILDVEKGNSNDIWIGTYGNGLNRIILNNKGDVDFIEHYSTKSEGKYKISNDYIRTIFIAEDGNIIIGTLGAGADILSPETGIIETIANIPTNSNSLINNYINSILEDSDGLLWFGTFDGLCSYNRSTKNFKRYKIRDGLPHNTISELQEGNEGNIWISTFKGLVKYIKNEDKFIVYTPSNGLQGNKFNVNASFKCKNGKLLFGGTTGFNYFDPKDIKQSSYKPPVALTNLLIYNNPVDIDESVNKSIILNKSLDYTSAIVLNHKHKIITFEFAALNYSMRRNNIYAYMLEGFDRDWNYVDGNRRFATYSNLATGNYTFRVKAANSDGVWNESGVALNIEMLPPPWKTWWAFILYSFIILGFLLLARNYSVSQANLRHKIQLQQLEKQKSEELNQLKLKFFTNVSHEFRTPLTLILGPVEKIINNYKLDKKVIQQLEIVQKNSSRLLNLVTQLMDFRKLDTGNMNLHATEEDLIVLLRDIKSSFDSFAKGNNIKFKLVTTDNALPVWCDKEMIYKIFYNLLSNAFKFTHNNGSITIKVEKQNNPEINGIQTENFAVIKIIDTGVGIDENRISKIFDRFYQIEDNERNSAFVQYGTGIGLSLTRDLVDMHKGRIEVKSQINKGSEFAIYLPLDNKHFRKEDIYTSDNIAEQPQNKMFRPLGEIAPIEYLKYNNLSKFSQKPESEKNKLQILIVDDNPDLRQFIFFCLDKDYGLIEAANGSDAYDIAIRQMPDLIISDIMMPVMDGLELCQKVKSDIRTSHIPIILLTAYNSEERNLKGYKSGADDYISKPFNTEILLARISNLINLREKLVEKYAGTIQSTVDFNKIENLEDKFIKKAITIVESNLSNPEFNVEMLSKELGMSRTNLFRKMKALTNNTAVEFIRIIKMKNAAQFLLKGYNISETMTEVAINSRSYFNKSFTSYHGKSPSDFIASHKS